MTRYETATAETAVARVQVDQKPFDDPRVRNAMTLAIDQHKILEFALHGLGVVAEHHHVSRMHSEYAKLPFMGRDVEDTKALLEEAGFPDGLDTVAAGRLPVANLDVVVAGLESVQRSDAALRGDCPPRGGDKGKRRVFGRPTCTSLPRDMPDLILRPPRDRFPLSIDINV